MKVAISHPGVRGTSAIEVLNVHDCCVPGNGLTFRMPLDPDSPDENMFVVVLANTGLHYHHEYGGHACRQVEVEGLLVPAWVDPDVRTALDALFIDELGKQGITRLSEPIRAEALRKASDVVRRIAYRGTDRRDTWLAVDMTRSDEFDEAWIPLVTPDGPGYLAWTNSD